MSLQFWFTIWGKPSCQSSLFRIIYRTLCPLLTLCHVSTAQCLPWCPIWTTSRTWKPFCKILLPCRTLKHLVRGRQNCTCSVQVIPPTAWVWPIPRLTSHRSMRSPGLQNLTTTWLSRATSLDWFKPHPFTTRVANSGVSNSSPSPMLSHRSSNN